MIVSKSTCGLCKPTKKYKKNNTRLKGILRNVPLEEISVSLVKSYEKLVKF